MTLLNLRRRLLRSDLTEGEEISLREAVEQLEQEMGME
jgi:hypothetical protein